MVTLNPILWAYYLYQFLLARIFSPNLPPPSQKLRRPRIAVIGAGLTGVSAAAHIVGHGFEVQIFEAGSEKHLGGIWAKVNSTSGLQIHSLLYRFFPSVQWSKGYPNRDEIVGEVQKIWEHYGLKDKTKFNTRVEKVKSDGKGSWYINEMSNGRFDGVIAAIGTCGDPKMPKLPGQDKFKGEIYHSSDLDGKDVKDKEVLIIGGGASAVEAMEFVVKKGDYKKVKILARSEKWIIPRNAIIDAVLAFNVFGQETYFSWIPETLLRRLFYRDLIDISPPQGVGLYTETPMVNSEILGQIRTGQAEWLRGDIVHVEEEGIRFNRRAKGVPKNGPGHETLQKGQVIIMATGYGRPKLDFLPDECFSDKKYAPPNWYLQTFPPAHLTICANNCTFERALGTAGNWHVGIYTRLLLMFLMDPLTRPSEYWMKFWIDMTKFLKSKSPVGAFDFFTYSELIWWFVFCVTINPFRWKWALFVFTGIGLGIPMHIVDTEDNLRREHGYDDKETRTY